MSGLQGLLICLHWTFFLWGLIKQRVYKSRPSSIDVLKSRIFNECREIETSGMLENNLQNFEERLELCISVEGHHFEQRALP